MSIPMTSQDALWLTMDRPNNLMVIDTVMWFRTVPDWAQVADVIQTRLVDQFPVFRSRAMKKGTGWVWMEVPDFSLDDQITRVKLDEPGDFKTLRKFVASQRSVAFAKSRPVWALYFIENVHFEDGSVGAAVLARFHHAIADGIRLTQAVMGLCDLDPSDVTAVGRPFSHPSTPVQVATSVAKETLSDLADFGTAAVRTVGGVASSARDVVVRAVTGDPVQAASEVVDDGKNIFTLGTQALRFPERLMDVNQLVSSSDNRVANDATIPGKYLLSGTSVKTVWSGTPKRQKDADWAPILELEDVKAVGRATGTTVNDVMISAVAIGLTRYLNENGDHKTDELIWMVPVSIQPVEPGVPKELGNHFALVVLRMPIGITDFRECLANMHERMERIKSSDEALVTFGLQRGIANAPSPLAVGLTNYFANKAVGVLTNVPGPRAPMTLAGTEVDGVLGWAPCSGDQPMTICIFSYNGKVTVGFGADKALVPDLNRLSELFYQGFQDMYAEIVEGASPR